MALGKAAAQKLPEIASFVKNCDLVGLSSEELTQMFELAGEIRSMIKTRMIVAAVALTASMPIGAAEPAAPRTIVQSDSPFADRGFEYFDASLGVLQYVRLDITPNFKRGFQIIVPGHADTVSISWDAGNEQYCRYGVCTNLIASGSATLTLTYSEFLLGGSSYAYIPLWFGGSTISTYFDPAQFVSPFPNARKNMTGVDPGLYDESLSDIFHVEGAGFVRNASRVFGCVASIIGGCDLSEYRLTYGYVPGGVPEPATWALMIVGFGGIGAALRHRAKANVRIRFA